MTVDRISKDEEDAAFAAEYVLGVLDLPDRMAAEDRIKRDPVFAGRVLAWERQFAAMNDGYPEAEAPDLMPAIEARLFGKPETRAAASAGAKARAGGGWWGRFLGGAGLAGALAVMLLAVLPPPVPPGSTVGPVLTATLAAEGQPLVFAASYSASDGQLVVTRLSGEAPGPDNVLELWVIAGEAAPVSLGLLEAPELRRALPALPEGAILAVSLEPPGGSPTGVPTGPVLVTGVVTIDA